MSSKVDWVQKKITTSKKLFYVGNGNSNVEIKVTKNGLDAADATLRVKDGNNKFALVADANADINIAQANGIQSVNLVGKASDWYEVSVDKMNNTVGDLLIEITGTP